MLYGDKQMDHAAYQKKVQTMTQEALEYTIRDAKEAMRANPENPNNGYYADEVCYCSQELQRRRTRGLRDASVWQMQALEIIEALVGRLSGDVEPDYVAARARLLEALAEERVQDAILQAVSEVVLP